MTQAERTVYAVGDIHGRADLLADLEKKILADWGEHGGKNSFLVFLGDYIDRGPRSRDVIQRLITGFPLPARYLRGNHDQMLLDFMRDPDIGEDWRRLGGIETLASYGVDIAEISLGRGFERAASELKSRMPEAHISFFEGLEMSITTERYFFCHAGVRPGVRLNAQNDQDLLWIRQPFLGSEADFGKVVVHGHTPVEEPEILPNRINVDTGAYLTGKLTCLILNGTVPRFVMT